MQNCTRTPIVLSLYRNRLQVFSISSHCTTKDCRWENITSIIQKVLQPDSMFAPKEHVHFSLCLSHPKNQCTYTPLLNLLMKSYNRPSTSLKTLIQDQKARPDVLIQLHVAKKKQGPQGQVTSKVPPSHNLLKSAVRHKVKSCTNKRTCI